MKVGIYHIASYCRVETSGAIDRSMGHLNEISDYIWKRWERHPTTAYTDTEESGALPLAQRPSGAQLIKDAQNGLIDALVVRKYSRLSPNVDEFFKIFELFDKKLCVPIFFIHDPADLNVLSHIDLARKSHDDAIRELARVRAARSEEEKVKARTATE